MQMIRGMHDLASTLHDTPAYGITSDPLTQFAACFAALIHDVDHTGLPNPAREGRRAALASAYNDRSVASRTRWTLPGPCSWTTASAIRRVIYSNDDDSAFRQLVVNSVMATDIMDKDLKELRNSRGSRFSGGATAALRYARHCESKDHRCD
jgi:hypothetical protein